MHTKLWLCLYMALKEQQSKQTAFHDHLVFRPNNKILIHLYKCISVQWFVPYSECALAPWRVEKVIFLIGWEGSVQMK